MKDSEIVFFMVVVAAGFFLLGWLVGLTIEHRRNMRRLKKILNMLYGPSGVRCSKSDL